MKQSTRNPVSLLRNLLVAMVFLSLHSGAWSQQADPDAANIARMDVSELALNILSVRTDLREYHKEDLATTSGQYELFYDEIMSPCTSRQEAAQVEALCPGSSLTINFFDYLKGNQRVCPHPSTGDCFKPARTEDEMRDELFQLVKKMRSTRAKLQRLPTLQEQDGI
jgi:hypothetical protein